MQKCKAIPPTRQNRSTNSGPVLSTTPPTNKYCDHVGENYRTRAPPSIMHHPQAGAAALMFFPLPHDVPFHPFSTSRHEKPENCASESQDAQKWITFLCRGNSEVLQPIQWHRPQILSLRLPVRLPRKSLECPVFSLISKTIGYPVYRIRIRIRPQLQHHKHANARSRERGHAFSALIRRTDD
jgi:hypothetical protein